MKNLFSLIFTLALASSLAAQTQKGSFMLGGSTNIFGGFGGGVPSQATIGFGKEKTESGGFEDSHKYTVINFSPNMGYFVSDGFMIGLNLGILSFNSDLEFFGDDLDFTVTTITPMLRYYFNNTAKTRPFGEVRGGIINSDSESTTLLGAKAGAAVFLNQKVSLDFFLDYSSTFDKEDDVKSAQNVFGFGLGFNLFL